MARNAEFRVEPLENRCRTRSARNTAAINTAGNLVDRSLDLAAPVGSERHGDAYDRNATATDAAGSKSQGGNPLAAK